jgi:hypothetical protein
VRTDEQPSIVLDVVLLIFGGLALAAPIAADYLPE